MEFLELILDIPGTVDLIICFSHRGKLPGQEKCVEHSVAVKVEVADRDFVLQTAPQAVVIVKDNRPMTRLAPRVVYGCKVVREKGLASF
jgi:hypothetical protein